jgi:hypothetical protein
MSLLMKSVSSQTTNRTIKKIQQNKIQICTITQLKISRVIFALGTWFQTFRSKNMKEASKQLFCTQNVQQSWATFSNWPHLDQQGKQQQQQERIYYAWEINHFFLKLECSLSIRALSHNARLRNKTSVANVIFFSIMKLTMLFGHVYIYWTGLKIFSLNFFTTAAGFEPSLFRL